MVGVITLPAEAQPFGPSYPIDVHTTRTAGMPSGTLIDFWVSPTPSPEEMWGEQTWPTPNIVQLQGVYYGYTEKPFSWPYPSHMFQPGAPARFHVRWRTPTGEIWDQTSVPIVWEPTLGFQYRLEQKVAQQTGGQGGLTTEQALQLETTTAAMGFAIGGGWSDLAENLVNLVGRRLLGDELITPDRSGQGVLTRPGGPFGVNAFGIMWELIEAPPGLGIDEGVPDRTEIDHMQLTIMRGTSQGLRPIESRYIRDINGMWVWGWDSPDQVDYYLMPGVVARFHWKLVQIGAVGELEQAQREQGHGHLVPSIE